MPIFRNRSPENEDAQQHLRNDVPGERDESTAGPPEFVVKGYNGIIVLGADGVTIKRGIRGIVFGGGYLRGQKFVPYTSIVAVQMKKSGIMLGYLQLSLRGGSEAKGGMLEAPEDENTVTFDSGAQRNFDRAREMILARITGTADTKTCPDCAESIKLAARACRYCGFRFDKD